MKKSLLIVALMFGLLLTGTAMAGLAPTTGITDSYHDLGTQSSAFGDTAEITTGQNRICIYCHAPHNTIRLGSPEGTAGTGEVMTYLPLWNHAISTLTSYDMYNNGTGEPTTDLQHQSTAKAIAGQPTGVSILCLSCHDGSVATNAYGTGTGAVGAADKNMRTSGLNARGLIGGEIGATGVGDLSNHHPVSFSYTQVEAIDTEIRPSLTTPMGAGKMISDHLFGPDGNLECASCHEVHNGPEAVGVRLTYVDDSRSAFCLTCHIK